MSVPGVGSPNYGLPARETGTAVEDGAADTAAEIAENGESAADSDTAAADPGDGADIALGEAESDALDDADDSSADHGV